jgi:WD40 repeat protein
MGEGDQISDARLSPDGRWLAVLHVEGKLTVWDAATGQLHATFNSPSDGTEPTPPTREFRFSPDSRLLAQQRLDGKGIVLWEIATGQRRFELADALQPFAFAPDGRTLATATVGKEGKLWDVASGQERATLSGSTLPVYNLAFSPDGRLLAVTHLDSKKRHASEVSLWDVASGRLWAKLPLTAGDAANPTYFRVLTFSPDSRLLVVPSVPGESPLWDVSTDPPTSLGHLIAWHSQADPVTGKMKLRPGPDPVFSPEGRWLTVPGHGPKTLIVLDTACFAPRMVLPFDPDFVPWLGRPRFSPDGRIVAVHARYQQPGYVLYTGWRGWLNRLYRRLFTRPPGFSVKLFEVANGRELGEVPGVWWGGFSPDGWALITAVIPQAQPNAPNLVHRWEVPTGRPTELAVGVAGLVLFLAVGFYGVWFRQSRRIEH